MYFDSHAHYNDDRFKEDMPKILFDQLENGVDLITNIGANIETSKKSVELANNFNFIYATVGVHPHDVDNLVDEDLETLRELAKSNKVVAIGEIGMDLYYEHSKKDTQIIWFKKQLELAEELNLPVVIHSRDSDQLVFDILKASNIRSGIIHCFSSSYELAREYVKLGFHIGIGGVVTFKNSVKILEVVEKIPLENIVLETDLPYLAPAPHRGERNESKYLKYICEKVANIKNIPHEEVARITSENTKKVYRI